MASSLKNLSDYQVVKPENIGDLKIALVVSSYHGQITQSLAEGAYETLVKEGAKAEHIRVKVVPGAYELTLGAQLMAKKPSIDAVICIGCVIKGDTPHFDFICDAIANGITQVSITNNKPVIFGVLTPNTMQQAKDRAGGKHGNKGVEAAAAALGMLAFDND